MIGGSERESQKAFGFIELTGEGGLFQAIIARTGRDIFAGVTEPKDRQAAARIAIVINKLEAEFGAYYQRIYGEPLPERRRITQPTKGEAA
jgi:hypothetical protein